MISFFGKMPARGDFVRINVKGRESLDLANYFEASLDALRQSQLELPAQPLFFLWRTEGARNALVGVMRPSQDKVGRKFPAAIFATFEMKQASSLFSVAPIAFKTFLDGALAIGKDLAALTAEDLEKRVNALPEPSGDDFSRAERILRDAMRSPQAVAHNTALFGAPSELRHYYAYFTLEMACSQARKAPNSKLGVTLDCPVKTADQIPPWLEMVRILLGKNSVSPCLFWTGGGETKSYGSIKLNRIDSGPPPRLWIAFGAPPPMALAYVAKPDIDHNKLWPLYSDHKKALELTRQKLAPEQLAALDNPQMSLAAMIQTFA